MIFVNVRRRRKAIIVGAGPAGLAAGLEFARSGAEVVVLESSGRLGGLSATLEHERFKYDIGGHRFFTKNAEVQRFFLSSLGTRALWVDRRSRIYQRGKFFDYPLTVRNALLGMGVMGSAVALGSFAAARIKDVWSGLPATTFEEYMIPHVGRRLYSIFFEGYTRKVWGVPCSQLSADWASQRIKGLNLLAAIKNAIRHSTPPPRTLASRFLYPAGGIGELSTTMGAALEKLGGTIRMGARVSGIQVHGNKVAEVTVASGERFEGDFYVFTNPLTELGNWLGHKNIEQRLRFRGLITVLLMLDLPKMTKDHWLYFPDPDVPFGRVHEPKNWSAEMAPRDQTAVVAEYFVDPGDAVWKLEDESLIGRTAAALRELGFIRDGAVLGGKVNRWSHAYPIYLVGYREEAEKVYASVRSLVNATIAGRSGMFRYHNMDHAIHTGWESAKALTHGAGDPFAVNIAGDYHERE